MPKQATRKLDDDFHLANSTQEPLEMTADHDTQIPDPLTEGLDTPTALPETRGSFDFSKSSERYFSTSTTDDYTKQKYDDIGDENQIGGDSPGVILRRSRTAKGLSVQEVADRLFLDKKVVENLEKDNYDHLPPAAFVQGYIRNYARLLALDPDIQVKNYFHHVNPSNTSNNQMLRNEALRDAPELQASSHDLWFKLVTWFLVLGAIAMIAVWWSTARFPDFNYGLSTSENSTSSQTPSDNTARAVPPALPPQESSVRTEPNVDYQPPSEGSGEDANSEVIPPVALPAHPPTDVTPTMTAGAETSATEMPSNSKHNLTLSFNGECWSEVYDSNGERLIYGTKKAGQTIEVEGDPPFRMVLGRVTLVTVTYKGETVDLNRFGRGIARFTLPLNEN